MRWFARVGCMITMLGLMPHGAQAGALNCSIAGVSGINMSYNPASASLLVGSGTVTLNCSKSGSNSDTRYVEVGADAGLNASGLQTRASGGGAFLSYGLRRDATLSSAWGDSSGLRLATSVTATTALMTTVTLNWWWVVPAGQGVPAGTYVDNVTLKLYQGSSPDPSITDLSPTTASVPVTLTVASQCTLSATPGPMNFNYTSFQTTDATASSSFAVTCTQGAPYTVSLDATSGTLLGLSYQLALSPSGPRTGTGVAQAMSLTGTMASGQSGLCAAAACSATDLRTVTISY